MKQAQAKLNLWVRLDGNGFAIPGSCVTRPQGIRPRAGTWRQITENYCCGPSQSFILFRNTTGSANITSIATADGAIEWVGGLATGGYLIFEIPNSYNETFTIITSAFSGRTITNTTSIGSGVISTIGALSSVTNTFTTTAVPGSQYLVILS